MSRKRCSGIASTTMSASATASLAHRGCAPGMTSSVMSAMSCGSPDVAMATGDPAGLLLVDLQDLPHEAVLPVGGDRAGVFQDQAVLVDPLVRGLQGGDELLRADDEDDVGGAPRVGGELA